MTTIRSDESGERPNNKFCEIAKIFLKGKVAEEAAGKKKKNSEGNERAGIWSAPPEFA